MTDGESIVDTMARRTIAKAIATANRSGTATDHYKTRSGQQIQVVANWDEGECALSMQWTVNGAACNPSICAHLIDCHIRSL